MLDGFVPMTPLHFGQNVHPQGTERVSESEQNYHMEASLSQLGQCWLPAAAPHVPEVPAVLLTAFGSLLCGHLHTQACWVLFIPEEPLTGHCWQQGALGEDAAGKSFCSLMTQSRSEANQQQSNTPQHRPFLNRDPSVCKGGAPPGPARNQGRQQVAN